MYVKFPNDKATKRLKGFSRVAIAKGEKKSIKISVPTEDLKQWDNELSKFVLPKGKFGIQLGCSSEEIKLKEDIVIQD